MTYNPDIHHRKSIRLKDYDYSVEGLYFITICTENRENLFGEIVGAGFSRPNYKPTSEKETPIMKLNEVGIMVQREYLQLEAKYSNIKCNEFVIMPNHLHCIIEIVEATQGGKTPPLPNIVDILNFKQPKCIIGC